MDSQFDLLLRGGRVIDPPSGRDGIADVGVRDGTDRRGRTNASRRHGAPGASMSAGRSSPPA